MPTDSRTNARDRRLERALELLNAEPTEDLLTALLEEVSRDSELAKLGPAIFARRAEIGSFNDLSDLDAVDGLDAGTIAGLIDGLNPSFDFESETLELVQWTHGNEIHVDRPESFGSVERRAQGMRIRGPVLEEHDLHAGWSWAHISIPVPTYIQGTQLYVRAVLFDFVGWPDTFGLKGSHWRRRTRSRFGMGTVVWHMS